jgi:hypothetical protein
MLLSIATGKAPSTSLQADRLPERKPNVLRISSSRTWMLARLGGLKETWPRITFRNASTVSGKGPQSRLSAALDLQLPLGIGLVLAEARRDLPRSGKPEAGPLGQQNQSLFVINGLPRHKFLGQHIHSAKERQLEEKSEEIQIPED